MCYNSHEGLPPQWRRCWGWTDNLSRSWARLGIPIFGSGFWDPHRKQNSGPDYGSKDSGWKNFVKFRCLESQKIRIPILKIGFPDLKKINNNSFVNTKVPERKPSPYKTAGELFFPSNLHLLIIFPAKLTSTHYFKGKSTSTHTLHRKQNNTYSHLTENMSRSGFGGKNNE
jgi:hypothetical protein